MVTIFNFLGGNFDILVDYRLYTPSINRNRVQIRSDLIVLNTTSWEWQTPSVSGPPSNGRYEHFASLYEDNSLIVGGGNRIVSSCNTNIAR